MTFCDFVLGLQTSSILHGAAGVALSYVIEWWKGYANLSAQVKRLVFLGLCLVIPLAAAGVGVLSCGQSAAFVETWWPASVAGLTVFSSGTLAHTGKLTESR